MKMNLTGEWEKLSRDFSTANLMNTVDNVGNELGELAKEIAEDASRNAPVDTGYMRDTLHSSYNRVKTGTEAEWRVMPSVYRDLPYLWVQNFNHYVDAFFFTDAFNKVDAKYDKRLIEVLERSFK